MHPHPVGLLLRLVNGVSLVSGRSWIISTIRKLATHPQVSELFRFIFLGTIVETGRQVAQWISDFARDFFVVKAEFSTGDFAYDWVVNYLENHRVWNESRSFKVVARNAATRPYPTSNLGKIDGHPDPLYEPATTKSPSFFRWRGYWMSITKSSAGWSHYDSSGFGIGEYGGTLVLSVWSQNRRILDEFVSAAREFYVNSQVLPRKQFNVKSEPSESLLTVHFSQGDLSYDWILEFLRSSNAFKDIMELNATTKQSDLGWGAGPKDSVRYMPALDSMQRLLFTSPRTGKSTWLQVVLASGAPSWDSSRVGGGSITVTLHSSDREVLADLINSAKQKYLEHGTSRVTVHLTDKFGSWAKAVTKSRRAFSTLVLPADIKEMILADAQEFLASEKWYRMAGIPHRRGYLLHGAPGTGKSSTVHAIAGKLGLEIYFISLASPGIDDFSLGRLISDTPSRCILLLEDIDCAFPSREEPDEDEEEEPQRDRNGNIIPRNYMVPPKSAVTLSGLLNVFDSVSSEEGRITFATIKYSLATAGQIEEVFKVFFAVSDEGADGKPENEATFAPYTTNDIERYAAEFSAAMPSDTYSIAQIQGYLLRKKRDPLGAAQDVGEWLVEQEEERRALAEAKRRWRAERAWQRQAEGQYEWGGPAQPEMDVPATGGEVLEPSGEPLSVNESSPPNIGTSLEPEVAGAGESS
ncbi:p-loop containing nucleoside triphosphate hydrolase protein [Mycena venus]|uniref:p-loop containing nucleoside triphosphate hydrolase protein n=1 Tax=Mycena venus TaxID=2733690 RepID=A0A8H7DBQ8_9AGAR|nr:p-loop containing nucleoside triphosphate hydrolase protein [Mycena venus]